MAPNGTTANRSGKYLEAQVIGACRCWSGYNEDTGVGGISVVPYRLWKSASLRPALVLNVPYETIYGTVGRSEFGLFLPERDIRIECKWQAVSGSVDEKFPYVLANMLQCAELEIIIICDGNGAKRQAVQWLTKEAGHQGAAIGKKILVCNTGGFMSWVQRTLPAYFQ